MAMPKPRRNRDRDPLFQSPTRVVLNERAVYMKTARNAVKLVVGGYVYRIKHKKPGGREYYACDLDCNATAVVRHGVVRSLRGQHHHGPDVERDKIKGMVPCAPSPEEKPDPLRNASQSQDDLERLEGDCDRDGSGSPCVLLKLEPAASWEEDTASGAAGMMDNPEAGPSGFMDEDVRVKMEPEWVDAGALEPNCELEGQFDDNQDFSARFSGDALSGTENQNFQMYNNQQQSQSQQLPLIQDSQDPVKLHVPGKPNLTITVAPTRQVSSQSSAPIATPPPLHLLNPLLNRKRGRPRGSAYGSYSESDDRVTTILTDSIIASQKLEKMGVSAANAYRSTPVNAASMPPSLVKPRSRDPEAVRAAEIVNGAQNRSGPRVTEELEKVHLKLRQEVLALEVQNLKAEREKLKAYRRNVAIRREIMALHLQLGKGFPSECASSGRGFETTDTFVNYLDTDCDNNFSPPPEPVSVSKKLPNVSITKHQTGQSPKISIRKSLQTSSRSPNASPLSTSSSAKGMTPPPATVNKTVAESRDQSRSSQSSDNKSSKGSGQNLTMTTRHGGGNRSPTGSEEASGSKHSSDNHKTSVKPSSDLRNNQEHESKESGENSSSLGDAVKEELVPLDSVSSDLSVEMLSEPGSSQWTTQSSAPMTEHEGFDDIQFEEDDSYDNTGSIGEFSGEPMAKEPPDGQYSTFTEDTNESKRRRVQNMWEPDEPL